MRFLVDEVARIAAGENAIFGLRAVEQWKKHFR